MALFDGYKKNSTLKAAIKQTKKARKSDGAKSEQLYLSAYEGFSDVVKGDLLRGEALYNWGFALLHQAKSQADEQGVKLYLDAISKFTFCLLVEPNHLGAAIDGGVAYMDLARIMTVEANDELYDLAGEFFEDAERIQRGSAAYNLACIYGLRGQNDACAEALELSKEYGSLPNVDDILNDSDLTSVKKSQWFIDFVEKVKAGPEPVVEDEHTISYDVEGNIINKNKKVKRFENEVDGVIYDAEGNILNSEELEQEKKAEADTSVASEVKNIDEEDTKAKEAIPDQAK